VAILHWTDAEASATFPHLVVDAGERLNRADEKPGWWIGLRGCDEGALARSRPFPATVPRAGRPRHDHEDLCRTLPGVSHRSCTLSLSCHARGRDHRKGDLLVTAASNVTGPANAGGRTTEVEGIQTCSDFSRH
jgi:hypothetical protein